MLNRLLLAAVLFASPALAGQTNAQREQQLNKVLTESAHIPWGAALNTVKGRFAQGATFVESFENGASASATDTKGYQILTTAGLAYSATAQVVNLIYLGDFVLGEVALVAETLPPIMIAAGLEMDGDATSGDGFEFFTGIAGASGKVFLAGVDPAFFFCATIYSADVSVWSQLSVGFRRAETNNAVFDNYLDAATIGISASAATAAIAIDTIDDNAATTTTDTTMTWADGETKRLCAYVSQAAALTYGVGTSSPYVTASAPTATAAFSFDVGTPVIPIIHGIKGASSASSTVISDWSQGYR